MHRSDAGLFKILFLSDVATMNCFRAPGCIPSYVRYLARLPVRVTHADSPVRAERRRRGKILSIVHWQHNAHPYEPRAQSERSTTQRTPLQPAIIPNVTTVDRVRTSAGCPIHRAAMGGVAMIIILVAAGSLTPFAFDPSRIADARWLGISRITWVPSPLSDIVVNLLVYLPVGVTLMFLLTRRLAHSVIPARSVIPANAGIQKRAGHALAAGVATVIFASLLSFIMEWSQTLIAVRVASWMDDCINAIGALLGVVLFIAWTSACGTASLTVIPAKAGIQSVVRVSPAVLAQFVAVGLVLFGLMPFDFITSESAWRESLAQTSVWPFIGSLDSQTPITAHVIDGVGTAGPFAALALLLAVARRRTGSSRWASIRSAAAHVAIMALAIESAQLFVGSHAFALLDWFFAVFGGIVGAVLGATCKSPDTPFPRSRLAFAAVLLQCGYLLAASAYPFEWKVEFHWTEMLRAPFAAAWQRPFHLGMADLVESALAYLALVMLARISLIGLSSRLRAVAVAAIVVGMALACQWAQLVTVSRYPDITEPVLAAIIVFGVWILFPTRVALASSPATQSSR